MRRRTGNWSFAKRTLPIPTVAGGLPAPSDSILRTPSEQLDRTVQRKGRDNERGSQRYKETQERERDRQTERGTERDKKKQRERERDTIEREREKAKQSSLQFRLQKILHPFSPPCVA